MSALSYAEDCKIEDAIQKTKNSLNELPNITDIKMGGMVTDTTLYYTPEGSGDWDQEVTTIFYTYKAKSPLTSTTLDFSGHAVYWGKDCVNLVDESSSVSKVD